MSNHSNQRRVQLHYKQVHDKETRREMRNRQRLQSYMESKQAALSIYFQDRADESVFGFLAFVSLALISAGSLFYAF